MKKNAKDAGADNLTPSIPQYFSWINNTNEGSTEHQTLANLDFFAYMKRVYGMEIKIYAWDAGNFDGAREGYGNLDGEKFRAQYPEGYRNIVKRAGELGIQMGLWGSPDGFGDDPETEKKRYDFFVHLCRDYNFGLFKLDGVCGYLRPEKAALFAKMLKECRSYVPGLIVLNHRLNLYEAEKHVTTYLWNGEETYTDVFAHNTEPAPHHRGYLFTRGLTDNLERLAEDHGVCISSCPDYFEDDLVYQAFGRCLILAPEIYGNPWLLNDSELPLLARVYNLHKRYRDILVSGIVLPKSYGPNAVSRGTSSKRIICTGNNTWSVKETEIKIGKETGIGEPGRYRLTRLFPYVEVIGEYDFGETAKVSLAPFRAALFEIAIPSEAAPVIEDKIYLPLKEDENGAPLEYIVKTGENTLRAPVLLGELEKSAAAENVRELYETAVFAADNDCLEARMLARSGETQIPEVKKCRDEFFSQQTYRLRGCENKNLFDGNEDTFFDTQTKSYWPERMRVNGGCLRVDFGKVYDADSVEIDAFFADEATKEVPLNSSPETAYYSADLKAFADSGKACVLKEKPRTQKVVRISVHDIYEVKGKIRTTAYPVKGNIRYFLLDCPPDRIHAVRLMKNGAEIKLSSPEANNMFSPFDRFGAKKLYSAEFTVPAEKRENSFFAVTVEGRCGCENAFVCAEYKHKLIGCPDRAPSFRCNVWEHIVTDTEGNYTFYLPADDFEPGEKIRFYCLTGKYARTIKSRVYLCEDKIKTFRI